MNHGGKLKETPLSFFALAAWSAWTCLLFLPAMHDRYGYLPDALLVLLCFLDSRYVRYAAPQILCSGVVYTGYLYVYMWNEKMPYAPPSPPPSQALCPSACGCTWG